MNRRNFIKTAGLLIPAAPAIVKADWLMPVKVIQPKTRTICLNGMQPNGMIEIFDSETMERLASADVPESGEVSLTFPSDITKDTTYRLTHPTPEITWGVMDGVIAVSTPKPLKW